MTPRRSAWICWIAGLALLASLLAAPTASAVGPPVGQAIIPGGDGGGIPDGPPGGGEGGDPDEFFLSVGPPNGPSIQAVNEPSPREKGIEWIERHDWKPMWTAILLWSRLVF